MFDIFHSLWPTFLCSCVEVQKAQIEGSESQRCSDRLFPSFTYSLCILVLAFILTSSLPARLQCCFLKLRQQTVLSGGVRLHRSLLRKSLHTSRTLTLPVLHTATHHRLMLGVVEVSICSHGLSHAATYCLLADCEANGDFIPIASGGDGTDVQYCQSSFDIIKE